MEVESAEIAPPVSFERVVEFTLNLAGIEVGELADPESLMDVAGFEVSNVSSDSAPSDISRPVRACAGETPDAKADLDGADAATLASSSESMSPMAGEGMNGPFELAPRLEVVSGMRNLVSDDEARGVAPEVFERIFSDAMGVVYGGPLSAVSELDLPRPSQPVRFDSPEEIFERAGDLKPEGEIVVSSRIGDVAYDRHFVFIEGRAVFAGFERADASAQALEAPRAEFDKFQSQMRSDGVMVMGLGQAGGESSFGRQPLPIDDPEVVDRLATLVTSQIAAGPESLAKGDRLAQFNAFVRARLSNGSSAPHTAEEWDAYIKRALVMGVALALPFDEMGARRLSDVEADASRILGIDPAKLSRWESHFDLDIAGGLLKDEKLTPTADSKTPKGRLEAAFARYMIALAEERLGLHSYGANYGHADESQMQWQLARAGMKPEFAARVDAASGLIAELKLDGRMSAACRALAYVFRSSELDKSVRRKGTIVGRWSEREVRSIISSLMNDSTWEVVGERAFRRYLSESENDYVNRLVETANVDGVMERVRNIDLTEADEDEIWHAIDESGQAAAIMDAVVNKMISMASQTIIEQSMSEELD